MADEFVKLSVSVLLIIFMICFQKWQLRLKNENFEISRNSAYLYLTNNEALTIILILLHYLNVWTRYIQYQKSVDHQKITFQRKNVRTQQILKKWTNDEIIHYWTFQKSVSLFSINHMIRYGSYHMSHMIWPI